MNALVANAKSASSLAVIRSLGRNNIEVTGASDVMNDFPLHSKFCKNRIHLRSNGDDYESRIAELLEIVRKDHYDVLMPVMDQPLLFAISKHKHEFEKHTRIAIANYEQFGFFNNKALFSQFLMEHDLPCPKSSIVKSEDMLDELLQTLEFPVIIKPHIGEGAEGVETIHNQDELKDAYQRISSVHGPVIMQEYVSGRKYTAVFLVDEHAEVRRFFVHRAIREYPVTGGPTCFLESIYYEPIYPIGLSMIKHINYSGLVSMEFIVDEKDNLPKIIDVNPRFYGPLQCAITAGVDLPLAYYEMLVRGGIDTVRDYQEGKTCRHLLFEDLKHLMSILKGVKSLKYKQSRMQALFNFINFARDDSYFILSRTDMGPAMKKVFKSLH